jgi:hypothetical protein
MSTIKDGGPAFPRDHASDGHNGMTMRDYFAAKAMQSMVVGPDVVCRPGEKPENAVARLAYVMADAMLKAREGGAA